MKRICIFTLSLLLLVVVPLQAQTSLERQVARMIIVGMPGVEITTSSIIVKDIVERGVGGVILFESNVVTPQEKLLPPDKLAEIDFKGRLSKLCRDIRELAPYPIIISIDQEGGVVNRLKDRYGFIGSQSQLSLGVRDSESRTRAHARALAEQLRELGFNTNFVPCVDLNINPDSPAIGRHERSFSEDAELVVRHSKYVMEEHHRAGIITALKHFPGHGSSSKDTHLGLTDVTQEWQHVELEPYRKLLSKEREADNMVMISHIYNRHLDPDYPATLSKRVITGLLRQEMGWDGVVITDDMHMKAITDHYTDEESLKLTINAGADMIILSSNLPTKYGEHITTATINAIVKQVNAGAIPRKRIEESNRRIERLFLKSGRK